jgi:predicted GIY-YIG superfamily endonuclease
VYSTHAQSAKFHLPNASCSAGSPVDPVLGVLTRCGNRLIRFASSLPEPGHLQLCDECVLTDMLQPSVYRFFDSGSRLLYVGCTDNVLRRFREHASPTSSSAGWWSLQRRHTITTYGTKAAAFAAESAAIASERPLFPNPKATVGDRPVAS